MASRVEHSGLLHVFALATTIEAAASVVLCRACVEPPHTRSRFLCKLKGHTSIFPMDSCLAQVLPLVCLCSHNACQQGTGPFLGGGCGIGCARPLRVCMYPVCVLVGGEGWKGGP